MRRLTTSKALTFAVIALIAGFITLLLASPGMAHEVWVESRSPDVAEVVLIHGVRDEHVFGAADIEPNAPPLKIADIGCLWQFRISLRDSDGREIRRSPAMSVSRRFFGPRFSAKIEIARDNSITYRPADVNLCNIS